MIKAAPSHCRAAKVSPRKSDAVRAAKNTSDSIKMPTTAGETYCATRKNSIIAGKNIKQEAMIPTGKACAMA